MSHDVRSFGRGPTTLLRGLIKLLTMVIHHLQVMGGSSTYVPNEAKPRALQRQAFTGYVVPAHDTPMDQRGSRDESVKLGVHPLFLTQI